MPKASELPIDTSATAMDMAQSMFGSGISIVKAAYTGADSASGIYSNGDAVAPSVTPSDTGVILSTGKASDITNSSGDANSSSGTSTSHGLKGDKDLSKLADVSTHDAAVFKAIFVPTGSELTLQVTFSSEEYLEYAGTGFNDAVGVWVNGVQAELTVGDGQVSINNINDEQNSGLYVDNPANAEIANTEMDGFTVTLTLKAPVIPGAKNSLKIGIADGGDSHYDSNLLIAGNSVQTALVAGDDDVKIKAAGTKTLDVLDNDVSVNGGTLTITAINGQPVGVGDTVTLASGEQITLNPDGSFGITGDGDPGTSAFSYSVEDEDGNSDTAFVDVTTVPCFVAGTRIATVTGEEAVEALKPGTLVLTRDHGPQPVRWVGLSRRHATGKQAPIRFARDALGHHAPIALSPNHRVLITTWRAELLFGQREVLVKAADLVNDRTIRRQSDGAAITYVHVLFDRHEIITGNGLPSESYHPGDQTLDAFDAQTRAEILDLIGDPVAGRVTYGPAARLSLKAHESRVLTVH